MNVASVKKNPWKPEYLVSVTKAFPSLTSVYLSAESLG